MGEYIKKPFDYELKQRKLAYNGKRLKVEELQYLDPKTGKMIYREHLKAGDVVSILAFVDDSHVILIEEPRTAVGEVTLGIPAGMINEGETPEHAAIRELEEETGYFTHDIQFIRYMYTSCGFCDEKEYIFFAKSLEKTQRHLDETEDIEVRIMSIDEVKECLDKNIINSSSTTTALLEYFLRKKGN